jgi:hypothetical protein
MSLEISALSAAVVMRGILTPFLAVGYSPQIRMRMLFCHVLYLVSLYVPRTTNSALIFPFQI